MGRTAYAEAQLLSVRYARLARLGTRLRTGIGPEPIPYADLDALSRDLRADIDRARSIHDRIATYRTACHQAVLHVEDLWAAAHGLLTKPRLKFIQHGWYIVHHASCQNAATYGKIVKFSLAGTVAYAREDYDVSLSFYLPSNARVGLKTQGPSKTWHVLAVCVPDQQRWPAIAAAVMREDACGRRAVRNARFTARWAERALSASAANRPLARDDQ